MAELDTRTFLEDLLLRYDPNVDLTDGSSAQVELIDPILSRIGPDPFSGDVAAFIRERLAASFPDMALTEADEAEDLIVRPMQVLIEPIVQEIKLAQMRSRLDRYTELSDTEVDAQMGNFFEARQRGGLARGSVRIYFNSPQSVSISIVHIATAPGDLSFLPDRPQQITAQQMGLNIEGTEYYFDVDYVAQRRGEEYNVNENSIRSVANLPGAVRVRNLRKFRGGVARETSAEFVARVEQGRHDGSLATEPGALARIQRTFPEVQKMQVIGFGDIEMERDIITGGAFSGPLPDDAYGPMHGTASPLNDFDGDQTTHQITTPAGYFVSRVGGEGDMPVNWYLLIAYNDGVDDVVKNARIKRVISSDAVELELTTGEEIPTSLDDDSITWFLQSKTITLGGIPGGILNPVTEEGVIEIRPDEVHVGGHVDYFIAGPIEETYSQIEGISDASPAATGTGAGTTEDSNVITLDSGTDMTLIGTGMSLTITEGPDAGTYTILSVDEGAESVTVEVNLTTTYVDAAWVISDDLEVDLMDPQEPRIDGDNLRTVANSDVVTTVTSENFEDSNVQIGDVLEIQGVETTEHIITNVAALLLTVDPPAPRTYSSVGYRVFRRTDSVSAPVVRIKSMEILDSDSAPVGAEIPPRDPVLIRSSGFHNEGSGTIFDGELIVGLVTDWTSPPNVSGLTLEWESWDAIEGNWSNHISNTMTFPASTSSASDISNAINVSASFGAFFANSVASVVNFDGTEQVALSSRNKLIVLTGGTALDALEFAAAGQAASNAQVRLDLGDFYARKDIRLGDLIQIAGTRNSDVRARISTDTTSETPEVVQTTLGQLPRGQADTDPTYALRIGPCPTYIPEKARVVIGRPSVGSARAYFEKPTSVEFRGVSTRFLLEASNGVLEYRPDPGNRYQIAPPYPDETLLQDGQFVSVFNSVMVLQFAAQDVGLVEQGVRPGDLVQISYRDIVSSSAIADFNPVKGLKLSLAIGKGTPTPVDIVFPSPTNLVLDDIVETINTALGRTAASSNPAFDRLILNLDDKLTISSNSDAAVLSTLNLTAGEDNVHPHAGEYSIFATSSVALVFIGAGLANYSDVGLGKYSRYRVLRSVQRVSSTQMSTQQEASGLYYADVELISTAPGNAYNIDGGEVFEAEGYVSDGFRLRTTEPTTTYSSEEKLYADISPTILLPGSSDSIQDTLRIVSQNVQVNYDRSQLVEDVQGYVRSKYNRHTGMNTLCRHLMPHYVNLHWYYVGGASESDALRQLQLAIESAATDEEFEINDLIGKLKTLQASSVFVKDSSYSSGRAAPSALVVYHDQYRRVRARVVTDFLRTSRLQRFIPGNVRVTRTSTAL